jgi:hypothetical protein
VGPTHRIISDDETLVSSEETHTLVFKVVAVLCSHHIEFLKASSTGGVSPTRAAIYNSTHQLNPKFRKGGEK